MNLVRFTNKILDRRKFTLKKYAEFLNSIKKYKVVNCRDFQNYHNPAEVVIALRHDIDRNIDHAVSMAVLEAEHGISSTYFVLHSAEYYLLSFDKIRLIQSLGHEIGIHNDVMSTKMPEATLKLVLRILKWQGLNVTGTAAHGNKKHSDNIGFWKTHDLKDFGLNYEAYSLDHNQYYSDCTFIDYHRWDPGNINWDNIKPGDRIQILIHSEFWS
jgi:hypothetical protein